MVPKMIYLIKDKQCMQNGGGLMGQELKNLKGRYHYESDIDLIYGIEEGFYFTLQSLDRKNMMVLIFSVDGANEAVQDVSLLRKAHEAIAMGGVYVEGSQLNIELNHLNVRDAKMLEDIVWSIARILRDKKQNNVCYDSGSLKNIGIYRTGTNVRILSSDTFHEHIKTNKKHHQPRVGSNHVLAWLSVILIFLGLVAIKTVVGSAIFFIPMILVVGAINLAVRTFENFAGSFTRRDAITLLGLFVVILVVEPLLSYSFLMAFKGQNFFVMLKAISRFAFQTTANFWRVFGPNIFNLIISFFVTKPIFQEIIGTPRTKSVSRKRKKLL